MKRREALKNIGLSAGFVLATPSLFNLLQSCTSDVVTWTPVFLSEEQGVVLKSIVDIILPKTDTPSATEVNVPEFIDKYANEVMDLEEQVILRKAYDNLVVLIKTEYNDDLSKVSSDNYMALLDTHMKLPKEETPSEDPTKMTMSQLLNSIKGMTIWGYRISETVGETILAYDPVPGAAYCGDLQELTGGKAWSL
jgi:phosphate/sulfate permease